ncbi:MAG: hypothetical protein KAX37_01935 [Opitutaceae bacterium]|nr:hypothetical protein [Opitutaceae bacterium]
MPALNFQDRFADLVEAGLKPHTIRMRRRHPIRPGQTLDLHRGMRTAHCRRLRPPECCLQVTPIEIDAIRRTVRLGSGSRYYPYEMEVALTDPETLTLAKRDGFLDLDDFFAWFGQVHGGQFHGDLIEWRPS